MTNAKLTPVQARLMRMMAEGRTFRYWAEDGGGVVRMDSLSLGVPVNFVRMQTVRSLIEKGYVETRWEMATRIVYVLTPRGIVSVADEIKKGGEA